MLRPGWSRPAVLARRWEAPLNATITAVAGLEVGHYTDRVNGTGCTVVICREGAAGGVDVRGGSPGTRETDLLRPVHRIDRVHALVLSGGSAFGLDAAGGVAGYLAERGIGVVVGPMDTHDNAAGFRINDSSLAHAMPGADGKCRLSLNILF